MKNGIKYIVFFIFTFFMCYFIYQKTYNAYNDLSRIDLSKANSLMIVAHPDDETIWGGAHLLEDDYLVVCITCGGNKVRAEEFKRALEISDDQYLMLNYPDKRFGKRDDWKKYKKNITKEVSNIIHLKKWDKIVTHNKQGEYGHIQHKQTNKIVTSIYNDEHIKSKLYFFGKYYRKKDINLYKDKLSSISEEEKRIKINQMIEVYKSQGFIKDAFGHMFDYENWIEYIL